MKVLYQSTDVEKLAVRAKANGTSPDLLLLVLALPETQGLRVWNEILSDVSLHRLPIAVLLAQRNEAAKALGIKSGTPDSSEPNLADVKRLLRGVESERNTERIIQVGKLVIDPTTYNVSRPGKTVRLTPLEFRLLYHLAGHPNRIFNRKQLLSTLWESGQDLNARIVDAYIWRLRAKLEAKPEDPLYLKTVVGAGYILAVPVMTRS